jgi:hypothetical protein
VTVINDALAVKMGEMHSLTSHYIVPEGIRVEFEPGIGTGIVFTKNASSAIEALSYDGKNIQETEMRLLRLQ